MQSDNNDNSDNSPVEIEVQAPQALQTQITPYRRKWGEENKQRVMDLLSFKDRSLEDIVFSAVLYVAGSMFCSSLIFRSTTTNIIITSITIIFAVIIIIAGITAWWLVDVVPESKVLVLGRLLLLIIGITLGVVL